MAGGIPIAQYLDWVSNTGPQFLSGPEHIVNNVSRRSFMLGKFLRGKPASEILKGSNKIQETLYLEAKRSFEMIERGQDITWQNPQKDVVMSLDWKFGLDHMAWDEFEYLGQTEGLTAGGLKTKYKDMAYSKQQRLWESAIDGLEDVIWEPPATTSTETSTFASMESGGKQSYSIPVFVNENEGSTTGSFSDAWTSVEGVSWATYSTNWDNKRETYAYADLDDPFDGLFPAFDRISLEINYRRPGIKDDYFENETSPGTDLCIAASKTGTANVMALHRISNDSLIQPQDAAYPYPRWNGAPIVDVQALDDAQLYGNGTAYVDELDAAVDESGPRYYFLNTRYLKMVFHRAKYFHMRKAKEPERKVGVYFMPVEIWFNLVCTSRRHQGLVSPQ